MRSDTLTAEAMRLTGTVLARLSQPAVAVMVLQVLVLVYLIPNSRLIGADVNIIYSYSIIFLLMLGLAYYRKTPLERLGWTGDGLGKLGKQLPRGLPWALLYGLMAFVITVALALWRYAPGPSGFAPELQMSIVWQQLLVITLTETVVFQALFPLIVDYELEKKRQKEEDTRSTMVGMKTHSTARLLTVVLITQPFFGLAHYFAYGGSWAGIVWASMMGTVWYLTARQFGMVAAWWSHLGINLTALGLIYVGAKAASLLIGG